MNMHLLALTTTFQFPASPFVPLAVGFFGLGTGYLIYAPEELFGYPKRSEGVDFSTGVWGIWMSGFMQFLTGVYLFVGLTWFHSFRSPPLYMAALAFTAYGVHWFAIGTNRLRRSDPRPNGFMAVAFTLISILGIIVFLSAHDSPVAGLFIGLTAVYVCEFFATFHVGGDVSDRALGFFRLGTGFWLMYLTFAVTLDITSGYHLWT
jgi:hypothetical protein